MEALEKAESSLPSYLSADLSCYFSLPSLRILSGLLTCAPAHFMVIRRSL